MLTKTILSTLQLVLSIVGTGIAGAVYFADRSHIDLPCTTGGGCELVRNSHWSHIGPLPVSLLGLAGYIFLSMLSVVKLTADDDRLASKVGLLILVVSLGGVAYSWYLQYVAAVFIGVFCIWCRASAITMTLLFLISITDAIYRVKFGKAQTPPDGAQP